MNTQTGRKTLKRKPKFERKLIVEAIGLVSGEERSWVQAACAIFGTDIQVTSYSIKKEERQSCKETLPSLFD
jgi:hypothetical protein